MLGTVGGGEGRGRGRETVKMQDLIMSHLIGKCHPKQCGISAKSVLSELADGEVGEGGDSQEKLFQVGSTQILVNKYEPFCVLAIQESSRKSPSHQGAPMLVEGDRSEVILLLLLEY